MCNVYAIEFEIEKEGGGLLFGHVSVEAPDALAALGEFFAEHPLADIREMRRTPKEATP